MLEKIPERLKIPAQFSEMQDLQILVFNTHVYDKAVYDGAPFSRIIV